MPAACELLDAFSMAGGLVIELRRGESTVAADYSHADALPEDLEQRLALIQEVLEQQLVTI